MTEQLKILVVDDNRDIIKCLNSYMVNKGYQVSGVSNVPQALSELGREKFDVAIVDICLEGISGISLLKSIKGREDLMPVVMMSAYETQEIVRECLSLGAYDFIAKPFRVVELEEILQNIQRRKQRLVNMGVLL